MNIIISKSDKPRYKLKAIIDNNKTSYFGASGYSDYTIHKDDKRKERYLNRHVKRERWDDPLTAGFYSRWILWNEKTIEDSLADLVKRFNNSSIVYKLD